MFYDIFLQLCAEKGIKPTPAALDIGVSSSAVVKWRKGATPSGETLQKIAEYFDVSVDDLLNEDVACSADYSPTFWKTFMALCVENKETPAQVCHSIGVSRAAATNWKKGAVPSDYVANKIAKYFNVDVDYLFKEDDLDAVNNSFYFIFTELCNSVGKSPCAVIEELGMNKSAVTNWKKRESTPTNANLQKIADYFDVSMEYLISGRDDTQSNHYFYNTFLSLCNSINKAPSSVVEEIGLQRPAVTNWRKRGSTPTNANLHKIAEYFDVSVDFLLGKGENKSSEAKPQEDYELKYYLETFKNRKEMRELFRVADKATAEDIQKAIEIIKILSR